MVFKRISCSFSSGLASIWTTWITWYPVRRFQRSVRLTMAWKRIKWSILRLRRPSKDKPKREKGFTTTLASAGRHLRVYSVQDKLLWACCQIVQLLDQFINTLAARLYPAKPRCMLPYRVPVAFHPLARCRPLQCLFTNLNPWNLVLSLR